jgi:hypothetical protein
LLIVTCTHLRDVLEVIQCLFLNLQLKVKCLPVKQIKL